MNESNLYDYQRHAVDHILDNPACGLFLDMGLGKTVSTLTAVSRLIKSGEVKTVLVVAPLRVAASVWAQEATKWEHLRHLTFSRVLGSEKQRKAALPPHTKADIYLINRENVSWLTAYCGGSVLPFDMVVIDELSSFKNQQSNRFKALRQVRPRIKRVVGLTGTPAPNSLIDLWSQLYLLDRGDRLFKTIGEYRRTYFNPGQSKGHVVFNYVLKKAEHRLLGDDIYKAEIYDRISDICISMKASDYLELPPLTERDVDITLDPALQKAYDKFEREKVLEMIQAGEVTAVNAAALTNKLLQFANGAVYDSEKNWHEVHNLKIEALEDIIEDAQGQPVLIFYQYRHDLERIKKRFKQAVELKTESDIERWNRGEIQILIAHEKSAGHGLNLQEGGSIIVYFGLSYSLEGYQQAIKRLHRQGQKRPVIVHRLVVRSTMDQDVIEALARKEQGQDALMDAVKARVRKYLTP